MIHDRDRDRDHAWRALRSAHTQAVAAGLSGRPITTTDLQSIRRAARAAWTAEVRTASNSRGNNR